MRTTSSRSYLSKSQCECSLINLLLWVNNFNLLSSSLLKALVTKPIHRFLRHPLRTHNFSILQADNDDGSCSVISYISQCIMNVLSTNPTAPHKVEDYAIFSSLLKDLLTCHLISPSLGKRRNSLRILSGPKFDFITKFKGDLLKDDGSHIQFA